MWHRKKLAAERVVDLDDLWEGLNDLVSVVFAVPNLDWVAFQVDGSQICERGQLVHFSPLRDDVVVKLKLRNLTKEYKCGTYP